jgi:thiol-disulfide isomerase/thioredoxin
MFKLTSRYFTWVMLFVASLTLLESCISTNQSFSALAPGKWRGVLYLDGYSRGLGTKKEPAKGFSSASESELPFNFDIVYDTPEKFHFELFNGAEKITVDSIIIGRDRSTAHDTIMAFFPEYGSYIKAVFNAGVMDGEWVVPTKNNYRIPFQARHGQGFRFTDLKKTPAATLTGKWETVFMDDQDTTKAIGEFQQTDNYLTGTFQTESGDYRFLEGTIQGNKLYLSCFDGAHAFLFEGKLNDENSITGIFLSGKTYRATWQAKRSTIATLGDPFALTAFSNTPLTNQFTSPEGKVFDLKSGEYTGKNKVILISGTWCPNCKDASKFLIEYAKAHPEKDLKIIGTYFERYPEAAVANAHLSAYKKRMGIPYDMAWVGKASKDEIMKVFPQVQKASAFPTLLFVNKQNVIVGTYTGFYGPATSEYQKFTKDFDAQIQSMN